MAIWDPLRDFDFTALESPEFKEDAVREEFIAPVIRALGYHTSGPARVVRSRSLEHPFVAIGSVEHRIHVVPDYLMEVDGRPAWILDAKSPRESVVDPKHLAQVYSYAIHRDVRVGIYAICNGREFVAFEVAEMTSSPRISFRLQEFSENWTALERLLGPEAIRRARALDAKRNFDKDLGLFLMKAGLAHIDTFMFLAVPVFQIGRVSRSTYSLMAAMHVEESKYAGSFDFQAKDLKVLLGAMGPQLSSRVKGALSRPSTMVRFDRPPIAVNIQATLSGRIEEARHELYAPLTVIKFHGPVLLG